MEGSDLTVSVALSAYNSGRYLQEQIDSILEQTRLPDQIVVGDDGSTDNTLQIVEAAQQRSRDLGLDIEWTILESARFGIGPNMDRIIAACRHDVIVVCDSDDVCLPNRFEMVTQVLAERPDVYLVSTDAVVIDSAGATTSPSLLVTRGLSAEEEACLRSPEAFRLLNRRFVGEGATTAYRRELVEMIPPRPEPVLQDLWFAVLAAAMSGFVFDERQTIKYRVHGSNTTGGVRRRTRREKLNMVRQHGAARNRRLLVRAEAILDAIDHLAPRVPAWVRDLAEANVAHQRTRSAYPRNRVKRLPHVLREASTGAYGRLARGRKDVLLDVLQPL